MTHDPSSIENDLRRLHAAGLDESLLQRLEACAEESWTNLDPLELHLEHRLREIAPARLAVPLMDRLEATLSAVAYPPVQPKIVSFPGRAPTTRQPQRQWWAAAAAVALFGGLAGWTFSNDQPGGSSYRTASASPIQRAPSANVPLVPAGFNRGLSQASDEGVVLQSGNQPHRVLKFVYHERVTLKDAEGRTYQVDQPRVEYIIVPTKTD